MTQPIPIINTPEQFEVALQLAADAYRRRLEQARLRFTVRLRDEAWSDPDKAKALCAEWDAEIVRLTDESKAKMAAIPKPPTNIRR